MRFNKKIIFNIFLISGLVVIVWKCFYIAFKQSKEYEDAFHGGNNGDSGGGGGRGGSGGGGGGGDDYSITKELDTQQMFKSSKVPTSLKESILILGSNLPLAARLGNLMFSYSSLVGLAAQLNVTIYLNADQRQILERIFDMDHPRQSNHNSCLKYYLPEQRPSAHDDKILQKLQAFKNSKYFKSAKRCFIYLVGPYLQSWRYFYEHRDKIKLVFQKWIQRKVERLKRNVVERIFCKNKTENCSRSKVTWIGVHVRRGDMTLLPSLQKGYTPATADYLNEAIQFMEGKFKSSKIIFMVATDDFAWCSSNIRSETPLIYTQDLRNEESQNLTSQETIEESMKRHSLGELLFSTAIDLAFISSCDHVIMTVGSYGWWAGYLSGGTVIYYTNYPRPHSDIAGGFSSVDHYLPAWIGMP